MLDQKARMYTTKTSSRRWPLQVFLNILDFVARKSVLLCNQVSKTNLSKKELILKVIEQITSDQNVKVLSDSTVDLDKEMEEIVPQTKKRQK